MAMTSIDVVEDLYTKEIITLIRLERGAWLLIVFRFSYLNN